MDAPNGFITQAFWRRAYLSDPTRLAEWSAHQMPPAVVRDHSNRKCINQPVFLTGKLTNPCQQPLNNPPTSE